MNPIVASVVGNVAGGVIDSVMGGGDKMPSFNTQLVRQHHMNKVNAREMPREMVKGARRAGIHPALLFGGASMSPPSWTIGGSTSSSSSIGQHVASMGQDISRSMMADRTAEERSAEAKLAQERLAILDGQNFEMHRAQIGKTQMETALLASQLKRMESAQVPPPKPSNTNAVQTFPYDPNKANPAQGGKWEPIPAEVISHDPGSPANEAGPPSPSMKTMRFGGPNLGFNYDLPGQAASEALESVGAIPASAAVWGHNMARSADKLLYGDPATIPKGYKGVKWRWNRWKQRWVAEKGGK